MIVLGIDPGLTGAMALLCNSRGLLAVADLPTCSNGLATGKMKKWLNAEEFDRQLMEWRITHELAYEHVSVCMERPIAMPSLPAQTIAAQFDTVGAIRALCTLRFDALEFVAPSEWKKLFGLKGGKEAKTDSRAAALRLYPNAPVTRAKDHNRAEAVLIGHWLMTRKA
jgi:hypothetical protein